MFSFLRKRFYLLVINNSEFLGPRYLAFGPFASLRSAELQKLAWRSHRPVIECLDVVQVVPPGYIKQEIL